MLIEVKCEAFEEMDIGTCVLQFFVSYDQIILRYCFGVVFFYCQFYFMLLVMLSLTLFNEVLLYYIEFMFRQSSYAFFALTLLVGQQEEHPARKNE